MPDGPKRGRPPLTEEQRAELEQQLNDTWNKMTLREKSQVIRLHRTLRELPPEERRFIHDRIERFLNMSPEERERIRQNAERWKQMTPEEREQARELFRQRRKEFDDKWRQEHPGEEPPPFPFRPQPGPPPMDGPQNANPQPNQEENP